MLHSATIAVLRHYSFFRRAYGHLHIGRAGRALDGAGASHSRARCVQSSSLHHPHGLTMQPPGASTDICSAPAARTCPTNSPPDPRRQGPRPPAYSVAPAAGPVLPPARAIMPSRRVVPVTMCVVATTMSALASPFWPRKRSAETSAYVAPPMNSTSTVRRLSPARRAGGGQGRGQNANPGQNVLILKRSRHGGGQAGRCTAAQEWPQPEGAALSRGTQRSSRAGGAVRSAPGVAALYPHTNKQAKEGGSFRLSSHPSHPSPAPTWQPARVAPLHWGPALVRGLQNLKLGPGQLGHHSLRSTPPRIQCLRRGGAVRRVQRGDTS